MTLGVGAALAVTLAIELPIVSFVYKRELLRMALACVLATSATNLAMNAWLIHAVSSYQSYLLLGELGATVLEALAYMAVSREHDVGRALVASGLANAMSFSAGLVLA